MNSNLEGSTTVSPLTVKEIGQIDQAKLSNTDKHYLRVLAHCLASFRTMDTGMTKGPLPSSRDYVEWLHVKGRAYLLDDESFSSAFLEQLNSARTQLAIIAEHYQKTPLELTLDHLINFVYEKT